MFSNSFIAVLYQRGVFNSLTSIEEFCHESDMLFALVHMKQIDSKLANFVEALPSLQKELQTAEQQLNDYFENVSKIDFRIEQLKDLLPNVKTAYKSAQHEYDTLLAIEATESDNAENRNVRAEMLRRKKEEFDRLLKYFLALYQEWIANIKYLYEIQQAVRLKIENEVKTLFHVLHLSISAINILAEMREEAQKKFIDDGQKEADKILGATQSTSACTVSSAVPSIIISHTRSSATQDITDSSESAVVPTTFYPQRPVPLMLDGTTSLQQIPYPVPVTYRFGFGHRTPPAGFRYMNGVNASAKTQDRRSLTP